MAKVLTSATYNEAMKSFVANLEIDSEHKCHIETGRKFDKIFVGSKVKFFVQRTTGTIYGAKSPLAPNTKWWYDTIYNFSKWNWTGKQPTPSDEANVRVIGQYGDHNHYEAIPPQEKKENA